MKLRVLLLVVFSLSLSLSKGQVKERFKTNKSKNEPQEEIARPGSTQKSTPTSSKDILDRLVYGGNMSLTFGSNTFIHLAPTVGYKVTDNFVAGVGFVYQYARFTQAFNAFTQSIQNINFESQIYGPKFLVNYFLKERFYGGAQFEYLNHDVPTFNANNEFTRQWTPVLFLEAGYLQPIGRKGFVQIGLKYNVLHDFDSPYGSAFIPAIGIFF